MRFLLDECCDPRLVTALDGAGHDAVWWRTMNPGASDAVLLGAAIAQDRMVVTHDVGIGSMVTRRELAVPGLVILRLLPRERDSAPSRLVALVAEYGDRLRGSVTVLNGRTARSRLINQDGES